MSSQEPRLGITGRSGSHVTRTARMVVRELGLRFELEVLHVGDDLLFGTGNICGRTRGGPAVRQGG